jgi:hypothetical protein
VRLTDYFRLGFAGVKAHKKRAFTVVIIVGLLFSVITAGTFILQGLENVALGTMLAPTNGKVLVMSSVDAKKCGEDCDLKAETEKIKRNIEQYGGKIIPAKISQTADGMFYKTEEKVFGSEANSAIDTTQVIVPLETAANIADIKMPERDAEVAEQLDAIREVREKTLGKVVENKNGERYYIADILPGGVYASNLSFMNIGQGGNPLDLVLGQIRTGVSQNFIAKSAKTEPKVDKDDMGQSSGFIVMEDIDVEAMGMVLAQFEDVKAAYNYYQDKANYCSETDRIFNMCGKDYKYQVVSAVSDPITTYENLQNVWLVFKIVAAVLAVIALIIAISTYGRLIGKDMKIISLYHALGANGKQIRLVYLTYLLMLSIMAVIFSIVVGLVLAIVLSLVNMTALTQVFTLGFGIEANGIWLVGWNGLILGIAGVMILAAVIAVLIGNGNFGIKELARKLK